MSLIKKHFKYFIGIIFLTITFRGFAQEEIPWLSGYSDEMTIGKESVRNQFFTVEGNECKIQIQESVSDRKGETEIRSWIFYISDIDPESLNFNARGKSIQVSLATKNDQKFISYFEEGDFEEYTDEIELSMTEVDQTRGLIEALKEHIGSCKEDETTWESREAAMNWLTENIGKAQQDDVQWEQQFSEGKKSYLVQLKANSVDGKGNKESLEFLFDMSDINSRSIRLEASGRTLVVEVPVKEGNRYIEVRNGEEKEYTDELTIYCDDIEVARQVVNALSFAVSSTEPERPEWAGYNEALEFLQGQMGEVKVGENRYNYGLQFDLFVSDILNVSVDETDDDGSTEKVTYSFYPADMMSQPELNVSRRDMSFEMNVKEGKDYIIRSSAGSISGYTSRMKLHAADIDQARDLISAWEYIIQNSEDEITSFENVEQVNTWMEDNLVTLSRGDETYEQKLRINEAMDYQIVFEKKLTEGENEITETTYIFYPEDLSLEEMEIRVRLGKLTVTLETGREDYIKYFENGELQNFTDDTDVYFSDPLVAKNFMAAIRFLKESMAETNLPEMSKEEAFSFLTGHVPQIDLPGEQHEQVLEWEEGEECKLKFTRIEQGKGGESDEFIYELMASDLSGTGSEMNVDGKLIAVKLMTNGSEDLIKPFKNGEVGDFVDEFTIYADDVMVAKKILQAFDVLAKACNEG
jgi:hypothetical protein